LFFNPKQNDSNIYSIFNSNHIDLNKVLNTINRNSKGFEDLYEAIYRRMFLYPYIIVVKPLDVVIKNIVTDSLYIFTRYNNYVDLVFNSKKNNIIGSSNNFIYNNVFSLYFLYFFRNNVFFSYINEEDIYNIEFNNILFELTFNSNLFKLLKNRNIFYNNNYYYYYQRNRISSEKINRMN